MNLYIFGEINKSFPKENYPTLFIDHIIDACTSSEVFYFVDSFSRYNQIQIKLKDKHKINFIFPWGTLAYNKIPFGLKNVRATFHWTMTFSFHDIKHIVEPYLDELPHILARGRTIQIIFVLFLNDADIIKYA